MPQDNNEFQFELVESVYFNQGSHVEELLTISLEPNVSVQADDEYVTIRGEIMLQGEFQAVLDENREELTLEQEDFTAKRYIESITEVDENKQEFSHPLPIEISVPLYRVTELEDIQIEMLDFNYEFPTNDHLKLKAVAKINGINKAATPLKENREEELEESIEELAFPSFEFELKSPEEEEETEELLEETREEIEIDIRVEEEEEDSEVVEEVQDLGYLKDMFRGETEERYSKLKLCIVQEDDTIETIAERFQISTLQLIKQNELDEDFDIQEGQLLYIPKK
ncbi:LysM peptidoglycan-binding domain-containing protein [Oceanobacillus sp. CAU 1775]